MLCNFQCSSKSPPFPHAISQVFRVEHQGNTSFPCVSDSCLLLFENGPSQLFLQVKYFQPQFKQVWLIQETPSQRNTKDSNCTITEPEGEWAVLCNNKRRRWIGDRRRLKVSFEVMSKKKWQTKKILIFYFSYRLWCIDYIFLPL